MYLFTHGRPGELLIDGKWLDANGIVNWYNNQYEQSNLEQLNILGCNFAKGRKGREAVTFLQDRLNLSIAASNDITGKDGDWDLEVGTNLVITEFSNYAFNLRIYTTSQDGNWNNSSTWGGRQPSEYLSGDIVHIKHKITWHDNNDLYIEDGVLNIDGGIFIVPNSNIKMEDSDGVINIINGLLIIEDNAFDVSNGTLNLDHGAIQMCNGDFKSENNSTVSGYGYIYTVNGNIESTNNNFSDGIMWCTTGNGDGINLPTEEDCVAALPPLGCEDLDHYLTLQALLPVELLSFSAIAEENNVTLHWQTASEINNHYFNVEHSEDAIHWDILGIVEGQGYSVVLNQYECTIIKTGSHYFQLQQVDFDGSIEYSNIVHVSVVSNPVEIDAKQANIYPNPVTKNASITIQGVENDKVICQIFSLEGNEITQIQLQPSNVISLSQLDIMPGMYFLIIYDGLEVSTSKLMIKH